MHRRRWTRAARRGWMGRSASCERATGICCWPSCASSTRRRGPGAVPGSFSMRGRRRSCGPRGTPPWWQGRRVGKTAVVALKAAHHIAVAAELGVLDRTALVIAPSLRQATETTRAARAALAKALPDVEFASDNKLQIELPGGARLIALPGEASTSRGFTASMAIAEESQSLEHADEIFATIAPTLATTGGPLIVVGTPMDYQDPLYPIFEGESAHDPSWTRFRIPTRWCPRVPRSFLEEQRRLLGEMIYAREFEAQWGAPTSGMFDQALLQGAVLPHDFSFATPSPAPPRVYPRSQGLGAAIAAAVIP